MHADLANLGWTEEQWNRIASAVAEEAQRARVAAQVLPTCGPEDPQVVAVPKYELGYVEEQAGAKPTHRLEVDNRPDLPLTTLAVNVHVRTSEAADPQLRAALVMFRRAANVIARLEDALIFHGCDEKGAVGHGVSGLPAVYTTHGSGKAAGLFSDHAKWTELGKEHDQPGQNLFTGIVKAISELEAAGHVGPYGCLLGRELFEASCTPSDSYVLPRDRILPFLQGPLVRSSAIEDARGVVVALTADPVEIVVASDIAVRYLQTTLEPRFVFRVSERIAVRIKDVSAVRLLRKPSLKKP
jgi:uncharacterized linocin/CFP29 family protein